MQYAFRTRRRWLVPFGAAATAVIVAAVLSMGSSANAEAGKKSGKSHHHGKSDHHGKSHHHGKAHHSEKSHHPGKSHAESGSGCASIDSGTKWGTLNNPQDPLTGKSVNLYALTSGHQMKVLISNYGGIVESIWVPNRAGRRVNVALGFPATQAGLLQYETMFINPPAGGSGNTYFGAIIGRYANRIANAMFTLNGKQYTLPANNGPNTLHGGPDAYNAQIWSATTSTDGCRFASLTLTYTDPAGKNGFPGTVTNHVTYTLTNSNALRIDYKATTDAPTVINLTNHTYFNLAGEGSGDVYDQLLAINANTYTPTNSTLIPTGQFASVAGTPFDFRTMKPIGRDIRSANVNDNSTGWTPTSGQLTTAHGYDHNWVLNGYPGFRLVSVAQEPTNGVTLWTYTDQPGVQMYSGNFLVGDLVGTSGHTYRQSDGFTLETQHYPDTPHHQGDPKWPSVVLNPGDTFASRTTYKFTTAGRGLRHRVHF